MQIERAANALFPDGGKARVGNVKFARGRARTVSADEMADQLMRADAQVLGGHVAPIASIDDGEI